MICPPLGIPKESGPTQVGITTNSAAAAAHLVKYGSNRLEIAALCLSPRWRQMLRRPLWKQSPGLNIAAPQRLALAQESKTRQAQCAQCGAGKTGESKIGASRYLATTQTILESRILRRKHRHQRSRRQWCSYTGEKRTPTEQRTYEDRQSPDSNANANLALVLR